MSIRSEIRREQRHRRRWWLYAIIAVTVVAGLVAAVLLLLPGRASASPDTPCLTMLTEPESERLEGWLEDTGSRLKYEEVDGSESLCVLQPNPQSGQLEAVYYTKDMDLTAIDGLDDFLDLIFLERRAASLMAWDEFEDAGEFDVGDRLIMDHLVALEPDGDIVTVFVDDDDNDGYKWKRHRASTGKKATVFVYPQPASATAKDKTVARSGSSAANVVPTTTRSVNAASAVPTTKPTTRTEASKPATVTSILAAPSARATAQAPPTLATRPAPVTPPPAAVPVQVVRTDRPPASLIRPTIVKGSGTGTVTKTTTGKSAVKKSGRAA